MGIGAKVAIAIGIMGDVLTWVIIIRALLSWFPLSPDNPLICIAEALSEPIVAPFRALLSAIIRRPMMVDFSPLLALLAIDYVIVPALQQFALRLFI